MRLAPERASPNCHAARRDAASFPRCAVRSLPHGQKRRHAIGHPRSSEDPQDVRARRRFGFVKGELTSFEDENLRAGEEFGTSRTLHERIERHTSADA